MNKEEKIEKRKKRAYQRKAKRIVKDRESMQKLRLFAPQGYPWYGISWGRQYRNGRIFICEMRYSDCEERGYCNGDC